MIYYILNINEQDKEKHVIQDKIRLNPITNRIFHYGDDLDLYYITLTRQAIPKDHDKTLVVHMKEQALKNMTIDSRNISG